MKPVLTAIALLAIVCATLLVFWGRVRDPGFHEEPEEILAESEEEVIRDPESLESEDRVTRPSESPPPPEPKDPMEEELKLRQVEFVSPNLATGSMRLEVADRDTHQELEDLTIRLLSNDRFAELQTSSPVETSLSVGTYRAVVMKPGYDPLEIQPFVIEADALQDLGRHFLLPGSAVLEGVVRAPLAVAGPLLQIELSGRGIETQIKEVKRYENFRFDLLPADDYHLIVRSSEKSTLFLQNLQLETGERKWLDLDLKFIDVDIALTGSDNEPFDGNWTENNTRYADQILFYFFADSFCCATATAQPWDPFWPSKEDDDSEFPNDAFHIGSAGGHNPPTDRVDRKRHRGQSLWPPPLKPNLRTEPLPIERRSSGLYRISNVPLISNMLFASCGPYFTEYLRIDLQNWDGKPIPLKIWQRCGASSEMLEGATQITCNSCHALPFRMPE